MALDLNGFFSMSYVMDKEHTPYTLKLVLWFNNRYKCLSTYTVLSSQAGPTSKEIFGNFYTRVISYECKTQESI